MVDVLVILDGASEPLRDGEPTSLELARTPALDHLAREGELTRLRTVAPGLTAGSEAAIPALLGWTPPARVDRAALEAAAHGIEVPDGERAWRIDVPAARARGDHGPATGDGGAPRNGSRVGDCAARQSAAGGDAARGGAEVAGGDAARGGAEVAGGDAARGGAEVAGAAREGALARAVAALRAGAPDHTVHLLAGHRLLLVGPAPLPAAALAAGLRVWPEGMLPPRILGPETVVVGARGAAIGAARLMGAGTIVPAGATGLPSSDLVAKAVAAIDAVARGACARVVVHAGGPDEASHQRDRAAKVASIESADRALVGPLADAVARAGGTLIVCPDHGCDPATGEHDAAPVPCVTWSPDGATLRRELDRVLRTRRRLTERAVAHLPESALPTAAPAAALA